MPKRSPAARFSGLSLNSTGIYARAAEQERRWLMPFCELYCHLIWRTRSSEPLIVPRIEAQVHGFLWKKALGMGAKVFAIDGIVDHVHMVASLRPTMAVSDFVGAVKGYSSYQVNHEGLADGRFKWQEEYGAFSFDRKRLPYVIAYVEGQKQHHAQATTIRILERTADNTATEIREPPAPYDFDDAEWRRELEDLDKKAYN